MDKLWDDHRLTNRRRASAGDWQGLSTKVSWIKLQTGFEREGMAYARINIESHESDLNNALFDLLEGRKDDVEREFGEPLDWERRNNFPQSRIIARRSATIDDLEEALEATRGWMVSRLVRFSERVMPLVEALAGEITDESLETERIEN